MKMRILAVALVALTALTLVVSADPALALSEGPRNAGGQMSCTLGGSGCGHSTGGSDGICSFTVGFSQQITLGNYGFSVPSNALITGIRVDVDIAKDIFDPWVRLAKDGNTVGATKTVTGAPSNLNCSLTAFIGAGGETDMWDTTWTPAEVNSSGFGVRVGNYPMYLDSARITVFYAIPVAVCGDGVVTHDEQCDDGNLVRGDGCSYKCQIEQALDADAEKCANTIGKDALAIDTAQGAQVVACLKAAQKGQEPDAQGCLEGAGKSLVKAIDKTIADSDKLCATPPAFGFSSPDEVVGAAVEARLNLVADVFGASLTGAVISAAVDKDGAACQLAVASGLDKLVDARTKPFMKCKKDFLGHRTDPALSAADLEVCLNNAQSDEEDVAAATAAFARTVASKCGGVDLVAAFPGQCFKAVASSTEFAGCVSDRAGCRVCQLINAADGLAYPCDFIDSQVDADCE